MPTYIEGDIPVGSVQSGELVLKNVVIETALPYKPPSDGSIRGSVPCEGDTCRINPDYVPSADDRAVLFLPAENLLLTVDGTDAMAFLSEGWKLVGVFDRATAETVAERIAANPPVDNNVIQLKRFMRRFAVTGAVMATAPVAKIALITGREKMLSDDVALGRITPPDPAQASRDLSQSAQLGEQGWRHAQATAAQIDAALEGGTREPTEQQLQKEYQDYMNSIGNPPTVTNHYFYWRADRLSGAAGAPARPCPSGQRYYEAFAHFNLRHPSGGRIPAGCYFPAYRDQLEREITDPYYGASPIR